MQMYPQSGEEKCPQLMGPDEWIYDPTASSSGGQSREAPAHF